MPNGFGRGGGRGFGRGGGWGFGFRGSSPPWPYVGVGRGGLPRCGYFLSGASAAPIPPGYLSYGSPESMPYYGETAYPGAMPPHGMPVGATPYSPQMTQEQELDFLRNQAQNIKSQLEQIDTRIKELDEEE